MFYGSYKNTLDAKGRLIVPKQFRDQLGTEFMITRGLDGCLYAYPMDEWTVFEEKLSKLPLTNKNARKVVRFFAAGATLSEMDKQGRVLIPENLREFAGMQKDVVVEGSMKKIEIWAKEKYVDATSADEIDESMEALDGLDIDL
ncbi:MAG TPA: division/cell wall cluster transcriptional repressor MraZ [Lachnospiraceae bacterium]|jgi:MraZ protein|nr:division/cell wall cluster transcriptional repressor MraZ [Lachnospiraceae bacterium]